MRKPLTELVRWWNTHPDVLNDPEIRLYVSEDDTYEGIVTDVFTYPDDAVVAPGHIYVELIWSGVEEGGWSDFILAPSTEFEFLEED